MPDALPRFLRTDLKSAGSVAAALWRQDAVAEAGFDPDSWLGAEERAELSALSHEKRRREWIAARAALKDLAVRTGFARSPAEALVRKDALGAPRLVAWEPDTMRYAEAACSISHCAPFVLCAVLRGRGARVGADVQRRTWRIGRLARNFVSPEDSMLEKDDENGDETVLWSFKESTSKLLGTGWACGFRSISCVETSPGVCEISDPSGAVHPGQYWWFGQHVLTLVWDAGLPPSPPPPRRHRGLFDTVSRRIALARRRRPGPPPPRV